MPTEKKEPGFFARFLAWFAQLFGAAEEEKKESESTNRRPDSRGNQRSRAGLGLQVNESGGQR